MLQPRLGAAAPLGAGGRSCSPTTRATTNAGASSVQSLAAPVPGPLGAPSSLLRGLPSAASLLGGQNWSNSEPAQLHTAAQQRVASPQPGWLGASCSLAAANATAASSGGGWPYSSLGGSCATTATPTAFAPSSGVAAHLAGAAAAQGQHSLNRLGSLGVGLGALAASQQQQQQQAVRAPVPGQRSTTPTPSSGSVAGLLGIASPLTQPRTFEFGLGGGGGRAPTAALPCKGSNAYLGHSGSCGHLTPAMATGLPLRAVASPQRVQQRSMPGWPGGGGNI